MEGQGPVSSEIGLFLCGENSLFGKKESLGSHLNPLCPIPVVAYSAGDRVVGSDGVEEERGKNIR